MKIPENPKYKLPLEMLSHWVHSCPNTVFLSQPVNSKYIEYTWAMVADEAQKMASYLNSLNLPPHSHIGIFSKNCAHWIISDLAIMMAGYVSVPVYPNLTAKALAEQVEHADIKVLFVGMIDDWQAKKNVLAKDLKCISFPNSNNEDMLPWYDLLPQQVPTYSFPVRKESEIMTIIYTSGTSGNAKGVMLSYGAVAFAAEEGLKYFKVEQGEKTLSYLTLAHAGERSFIEIGGLYSGSHIHFIENIATFIKTLQAVQPTYFLGVPQVWKKLQEGILNKIPQKRLTLLLRIPFIARLVKNKIKKGLGFGSIKVAISGASALGAAQKKWFRELDINLMEVYSMTENFGYSHVNTFEDAQYESVGKALYNNEVKIDFNGEVWVKSPALFKGYYKAEKLNEEVFDKNGYFRTGDQGYENEAKYLTISGRCGDNFKNSKGKYVTPAKIEALLNEYSIIAMSCVMGSNMEKPHALVCLSEMGKNLIESDLISQISNIKRELNNKLEKHERLLSIKIDSDDWTVDNGLLTPTLKIIRLEIEKKQVKMPVFIQNG